LVFGGSLEAWMAQCNEASKGSNTNIPGKSDSTN